ncbi:DNA polymerase epsilon subunit 3 [Bacillus rossius redtenbacheri]|uniref:DNA polymerase epsilon subunit 3 n=1 Tax=Bacillus rossius redtenbacheri TaxID=93214 RepID=UPI002FDE5681
MAERIEDLNLPNAVVTRIAKEALPDGVNIAKDARTALAKVASIFVLYVTSSANKIAHASNHKTVSGTDVLQALEEAEFEAFAEPLQKALEAYKKVKKVKKDSKRKQPTKESENLVTVDDN